MHVIFNFGLSVFGYRISDYLFAGHRIIWLSDEPVNRLSENRPLITDKLNLPTFHVPDIL